MRVPVNIASLKGATLRVVCPSCGGVVPSVETRYYSTIWFCATCDVFLETTPSGSYLRSFKKKDSQVINLQD
jgi:ribosomal protein L37AE/L43A